MIILSNDDIKPILDYKVALDKIHHSYVQLITGEGVCRPHTVVQIPTDDPEEIYQWGSAEGGSTDGYFAVRMMSDVRYQAEREGRRIQEKYCIRPGTYCGLVFLFRVSNGEPLALLNDGLIQQARVGIDAAIGVKYMARDAAEVVGMFGAGGLARSLIASIRLVREIKRVQIYDPVIASSERFAREMVDRYQIDVTVLRRPEDVYKEASILAECTNAVGYPVILGEYVETGTHIVTVGRRLDEEAFKRIDRSLRFGNATSVIGQRAILDEHVAYVTPKISGGKQVGESPGFRRDVDPAKTIYLKDLLDGAPGRESPDQITYSERGNIMGAQFHAIAGHIYELAKERGIGTEVPTELFVQDVRS
jgi:ornithine cyclodeaminase/alanine dehydrogenase-like protein (mu-crystallin family)